LSIYFLKVAFLILIKSLCTISYRHSPQSFQQKATLKNGLLIFNLMLSNIFKKMGYLIYLKVTF